MPRIRADEFWPLYRDEVWRTGSLDVLKNSTAWTCTAIKAAKTVCQRPPFNLKTGNELYLDLMAYEQRQPGVNYNWDLRVAFEHENGRNWHDELCKLCHIVADLRILVAYFGKRENIRERLQRRIDEMGNRMNRVPNSEFLFIFGPDSSEKDKRHWLAFALDPQNHLTPLTDDKPFNPFAAYSARK